MSPMPAQRGFVGPLPTNSVWFVADIEVNAIGDNLFVHIDDNIIIHVYIFKIDTV